MGERGGGERGKEEERGTEEETARVRGWKREFEGECRRVGVGVIVKYFLLRRVIYNHAECI